MDKLYRNGRLVKEVSVAGTITLLHNASEQLDAFISAGAISPDQIGPLRDVMTEISEKLDLVNENTTPPSPAQRRKERIFDWVVGGIIGAIIGLVLASI